MRTEIIDRENRKIIETTKPKVYFMKKIKSNQLDKSLAELRENK